MPDPDLFFCAMPEAVPPRPRCSQQCATCASHQGTMVAPAVPTTPHAEDSMEGPVGHERRRMPVDRIGITSKAVVGDFRFYLTAGEFEDGTLGEVFVKGAGKEGSTTQGLIDAWATSFSINLQHGAKLGTLARKFAHMRFDPAGPTNDPDIPYAHSLIDYVVRWLALRYGDEQLKADLARISVEMMRRV